MDKKSLIDLCDEYVRYWNCNTNRMSGISLLYYGKIKGYHQPPSLKCLAGSSIKKQLYYKAIIDFVNHCHADCHLQDPEHDRLLQKSFDIKYQNLEQIQEFVRQFYHE